MLGPINYSCNIIILITIFHQMEDSCVSNPLLFISLQGKILKKCNWSRTLGLNDSPAWRMNKTYQCLAFLKSLSSVSRHLAISPSFSCMAWCCDQKYFCAYLRNSVKSRIIGSFISLRMPRLLRFPPQTFRIDVFLPRRISVSIISFAPCYSVSASTKSVDIMTFQFNAESLCTLS